MKFSSTNLTLLGRFPDEKGRNSRPLILPVLHNGSLQNLILCVLPHPSFHLMRKTHCGLRGENWKGKNKKGEEGEKKMNKRTNLPQEKKSSQKRKTRRLNDRKNRVFDRILCSYIFRIFVILINSRLYPPMLCVVSKGSCLGLCFLFVCSLRGDCYFCF